MKQWIVAYTKARHEKTVVEQLNEKDIETYLPLIRQRHKWSDRMKWVELPLFNSYVFIRTELKDQLNILQTRGVHHIVKFQKNIAVVPDVQIKNLKQIIEGGFEPLATDYFVVGDEVEVVGGPMRGIDGIVTRSEGKDRLIIKIDVIQGAVAVQIDRRYLKAIKR